MSFPVIAFFNNKGGVGKTSLVYHLCWMFQELGRRVLVADLDPQANLTAAFLDDDRLEDLWPDGEHPETIYGAIEPLLKGTGDVSMEPHLEQIEEGSHLLVGDLALSLFEDELSQQWPNCLDGKERAFRVITAFWRVLQAGAQRMGADIILMDLGPNLGAINRAALVASDHLVIPLAPDLFSLQGLRNLGPTVRKWRSEWKERLKKAPLSKRDLPEGKIDSAGYVVMQHAVRLDRPVKAYEKWVLRIPQVYSSEVLEKPRKKPSPGIDSNCLGLIKHYRSLMPMAQEARKPMFQLTPADGAIGAHAKSVKDALKNFKDLALKINESCELPAAMELRD